MSDITLAVFWFLTFPVLFLIAAGKGGMIVSCIKWTVAAILKLIFWLIMGYLVVEGVT